MKIKITFLSLAVLMAVSFFITSCSKTATAAATANLLVVHASPDAPALDILVDDVKVNSDSLFFLKNTGYISIASGVRKFKVNTAGTSTTVVTSDLTVAENMNYSVFTYVKGSGTSMNLVLTDSLTTPASGKAHVRFVHLSPNSGTWDLVDGTSKKALFENIGFERTSKFMPFDAGKYKLELSSLGTAFFKLPETTFEAGKSYTVFAKGFQGRGGAQGLGAEIIVNK